MSASTFEWQSIWPFQKFKHFPNHQLTLIHFFPLYFFDLMDFKCSSRLNVDFDLVCRIFIEWIDLKWESFKSRSVAIDYSVTLINWWFRGISCGIETTIILKFERFYYSLSHFQSNFIDLSINIRKIWIHECKTGKKSFVFPNKQPKFIHLPTVGNFE